MGAAAGDRAMDPSRVVDDGARAGGRARTVLPVVALAIVALAAAIAGRRASAPSTPASRGAAIAIALGCTTCHGAHGAGGVPNPGARDGVVPGWDGLVLATYARDEAEVREWILDGRPKRLPPPGADGRPRPALPMPAYRGRLTDVELGDLMAYLRAVSAFGVELSETCYEGRKIALELGCFSCHGPAGVSAPPNPGSFKGYIPPWDGDEWSELVRDEAELREWILDGRPKRLADDPLARHFLDGQAVRMPAYRAHLSEDDTNRLVAYLQWLRKQR